MADFTNPLEVELEALASIYITELTYARKPDGSVKNIKLLLHPATGHDTTKQYVCMTLIFSPGKEYPDEPPDIEIRNPRGLGEEEVASLAEDMKLKAEEMRGEVMLFTLTEMAKDSLTEGNIPHCPCVVCLEHFKEDDRFHRTACYHYFHNRCLYQYIRHCRAQQEEDEREAGETRHLESGDSQEKFLVCPVCRTPLDPESLEITATEEELRKAKEESDAETFTVTPELREQQRDMAQRYQRQKEKGGVIDAQYLKNRYLVNPDDRVPLRSVTPTFTAAETEALDRAEGHNRRDRPVDGDQQRPGTGDGVHRDKGHGRGRGRDRGHHHHSHRTGHRDVKSENRASKDRNRERRQDNQGAGEHSVHNKDVAFTDSGSREGEERYRRGERFSEGKTRDGFEDGRGRGNRGRGRGGRRGSGGRGGNRYREGFRQHGRDDRHSGRDSGERMEREGEETVQRQRNEPSHRLPTGNDGDLESKKVQGEPEQSTLEDLSNAEGNVTDTSVTRDLDRDSQGPEQTEVSGNAEMRVGRGRRTDGHGQRHHHSREGRGGRHYYDRSGRRRGSGYGEARSPKHPDTFHSKGERSEQASHQWHHQHQRDHYHEQDRRHHDRHGEERDRRDRRGFQRRGRDQTQSEATAEVIAADVGRGEGRNEGTAQGGGAHGSASQEGDAQDDDNDDETENVKKTNDNEEEEEDWEQEIDPYAFEWSFIKQGYRQEYFKQKEAELAALAREKLGDGSELQEMRPQTVKKGKHEQVVVPILQREDFELEPIFKLKWIPKAKPKPQPPGPKSILEKYLEKKAREKEEMARSEGGQQTQGLTNHSNTNTNSKSDRETSTAPSTGDMMWTGETIGDVDKAEGGACEEDWGEMRPGDTLDPQEMNRPEKLERFSSSDTTSTTEDESMSSLSSSGKQEDEDRFSGVPQAFINSFKKAPPLKFPKKGKSKPATDTAITISSGQLHTDGDSQGSVLASDINNVSYTPSCASYVTEGDTKMKQNDIVIGATAAPLLTANLQNYPIATSSAQLMNAYLTTCLLNSNHNLLTHCLTTGQPGQKSHTAQPGDHFSSGPKVENYWHSLNTLNSNNLLPDQSEPLVNRNESLDGTYAQIPDQDFILDNSTQLDRTRDRPVRKS